VNLNRLAAMHKRRIPGSRTALWRFIDRRDLTFKKKPMCSRATSSRRGASASTRGFEGFLDTTRLVFIDETSITTNMTRVRGRCLRGERLVNHVPLGEWKTITFIAGLRHNKMTAPMVIDGAMNGPAFLGYIEKCLGPTLRRGETVVMDNCPVHKVAGVKEAIERRGATVAYLPAYSPDLNPIELSFSKFKSYLRKFSERTAGALCRRVGAFIPTLSRAECRNYFRHAGYVSI